MGYNFNKIEEKWQKKLEEEKVFSVKENKNKKKFYILEMFPYPSGAGLHMGHALNFTIGDIFARFKKLQGFNVMHPMGFDALGLPAENAAIKSGEHPKEYTKKATTYFTKQMKKLGFSYDWDRKVETIDPEYYKWDQWIFLKMFEKGLAYRKKSAVNFCPKCNTVLANEQAQGGKCERCDSNIEIKHLEQWFFKITDYANELYDKIDQLNNWPSRTKAMQKNWIGKSYGTEILFDIFNNEKSLGKWPVFTTRPDTIFGVTFMVVSAQHQKLMELVTKEQKKEVEKFLKKLKSVSEKELEEMEKQGVFTGSYARNPMTNEKIPVYAGNFVVADYGCGMVMAVPSHDQRDFEFARKYNLEIKQVISGKNKENVEERAYVGEGKLINSGEFSGIENKKAIEEITKYFEKKKLGKRTINFKLRDWLISRQRYWGTPIPIVYCDKCGIVPLKEKDLPIKLPEKVKFGKGNPLTTNEKWINTKCPKCGGKAKRETDTMDTFVNSSWYFLRYCDSKNKTKIFDKQKVKYWCPIDFYIGGKEHACMHLIYFRFYTKFLRDIGLLDFDEPVERLFHQGILQGEDGNKMSKSAGNGIDPIDTIKKYGADSLRMFLVSVASPDSDFNWNEKGIESTYKFLNKIYSFSKKVKFGKSSLLFESKINKTIKEITEDIENMKYNLSVIKLRKLFDLIFEEKEISKKDFEKSLKLLNVFCPYITEEIWHNLGNKNFISLEKWPVADDSKINEKLEKQEEFIKKVGEDINHIKGIIKINNPIAYIYSVPSDLQIINENKQVISKLSGVEVIVYAVNDKNKYDPENKSKNVKPGRPGIFLKEQ